MSSRSYGLLKSALAVLVCVSLAAYPVTGYAEPVVKVEVDTPDELIEGITKFMTGEGMDGEQMKRFLEAPKREWSAILDRFAERFGFSPGVLSALGAGTISFAVGEEGMWIGTEQKDPKQVDDLVDEIAKFVERWPGVKEKVKVQEKDGAVFFSFAGPGDGGCAAAKGTRFVWSIGDNAETVEKFCADFLAGTHARIADRKDTCPELRGRGLVIMQDFSSMLPKEGEMPGGGDPMAAAMMKIFGPTEPAFTRLYYENNNLWMVGYVPGRTSLGARLYVDGPVSASALKWLPAECEAAGGFHVDVPGLLPKLLGEPAPPEPGAPFTPWMLLEQLKMNMGIDLQNDLLAHFGNEVVFGQLPVARGGGFPLFSSFGLGSMYVVLSVENPEGLQAGLDTLLNVLGAFASMDTVGGGLRDHMIGTVRVKSIHVGCGIGSLCFAPTGRHLVVTTNVPLMEYLLKNQASWTGITEDEDFKATLAELGGTLPSGFSYKRHHKGRPQGIGLGGSMTSVAVIGILAGMLLPALARAREEARKTVCKSNLKNIGLCCKMYAQDHQDKWPRTLSELYPTYVTDLDLFECPSQDVDIKTKEQIDELSPYVLVVSGMSDEEASTRVAVYEKVGAHDRGSNVLYGDGHVRWVSNYQLSDLLGETPRAWDPAAAAAAAGSAAGAPAEAPSSSDLGRFLLAEARNLGTSVDFSIFPAMGDFAREGSSNMSIVEKRKEGVFTKAKVGHSGGAGGESLLGTVAIVSIIAAIAVPSLLRAREAANETNAAANLKGMMAHQAVFKRIDAEGNGVNDYWTADIAAFYALKDGEGKLLKFVDVATAKADAAPSGALYDWKPPAVPVPKAGYLYKVMTTDEAGNPYQVDTTPQNGDTQPYNNQSDWAVCAYPAEYGKSGVRTFIVNAEGVVYGKDVKGLPVDTWPGADPTASGWAVVQE